MGVEIERKFAVKSEFKALANSKYEIKQGYLSTDPERTVRVRVKNKLGFITVKGVGNSTGMTRFEWENEIPYNEAIVLLDMCIKPIIEKVRYHIEFCGYIFEVDEFFGENAGLLIAEVELESENELIELPGFIGEELTNDKRYYNSYLSKHPFTGW